MTTNSLPITLTTLTPLWTGGADGTCKSGPHITGIMGSLRWWYEVLVRGVGGRVCDMNSPCKDDKDDKPYQGLCDVCRLFGATGWARRFKLIVSEQKLEWKQPAASTIDNSGNRVFRLSADHPADHDPRWYLPGNPLYGNVTLEIVATLPLEEKGNQLLNPQVIAGLIQLIADRGSLGAKSQLGMGVVQLASRQSTQPLLAHLKELVEKHKHRDDRRDYYEYYDDLP